MTEMSKEVMLFDKLTSLDFEKPVCEIVSDLVDFARTHGYPVNYIDKSKHSQNIGIKDFHCIDTHNTVQYKQSNGNIIQLYIGNRYEISPGIVREFIIEGDSGIFVICCPGFVYNISMCKHYIDTNENCLSCKFDMQVTRAKVLKLEKTHTVVKVDVQGNDLFYLYDEGTKTNTSLAARLEVLLKEVLPFDSKEYDSQVFSLQKSNESFICAEFFKENEFGIWKSSISVPEGHASIDRSSLPNIEINIPITADPADYLSALMNKLSNPSKEKKTMTVTERILKTLRIRNIF